jgi:filamentous hemagglutinin family protein
MNFHCFTHKASAFFTILIGACLQFGIVPASQAAVTSAISADGILGTTVSKSGNVFDINGGTIKGTNQFHSFGLFSVGTGDIASFNGPSSITNILGRVIGWQQSQIDGTLRTTIPGANLYLVNPAGVLFGPNASLNVSGSFHVGAVISAESSGAGDAGNIRIMASDSFVARNSTVTTEAVQSDGGNIELQVGHLIHLSDSTLSAKVGGGSSTVGGNITVDPEFFIVERSRIIANAFQGRQYQDGSRSIFGGSLQHH